MSKSLNHLMEAGFALTADSAVFATVCFAVIGAVAAGYSLYLIRIGRLESLFWFAATSILGFVGSWVLYGEYQKMLALSNRVPTGPIYETIALIILASLPLGLTLQVFLSRPNNTSK